jgi:hypothetical protein
MSQFDVPFVETPTNCTTILFAQDGMLVKSMEVPEVEACSVANRSPVRPLVVEAAPVTRALGDELGSVTVSGRDIRSAWKNKRRGVMDQRNGALEFQLLPDTSGDRPKTRNGRGASDVVVETRNSPDVHRPGRGDVSAFVREVLADRRLDTPQIVIEARTNGGSSGRSVRRFCRAPRLQIRCNVGHLVFLGSCCFGYCLLLVERPSRVGVENTARNAQRTKNLRL